MGIIYQEGYVTHLGGGPPVPKLWLGWYYTMLTIIDDEGLDAVEYFTGSHVNISSRRIDMEYSLVARNGYR